MKQASNNEALRVSATRARDAGGFTFIRDILASRYEGRIAVEAVLTARSSQG